jgi:hypothetical protein
MHGNSGSTATIIRFPYTSTLKNPKHEFLYRTTDFAIWSTVEVGVGITASCIATLKPLLKSTFSDQSTRLPWSRNIRSRFGSNRGVSRLGTQPLDHIKPTGKSITTIVTGGRISSDSDVESIPTDRDPSSDWTSTLARSQKKLAMVTRVLE